MWTVYNIGQLREAVCTGNEVMIRRLTRSRNQEKPENVAKCIIHTDRKAV
jgi:hypothetical protein